MGDPVREGSQGKVCEREYDTCHTLFPHPGEGPLYHPARQGKAQEAFNINTHTGILIWWPLLEVSPNSGHSSGLAQWAPNSQHPTEREHKG